MSDPRVLRHVIASITAASRAHASAAADAIAAAGTPMLEHLARRVAGSQHARPRAEHRTIVVACGDHGAGDPGIALGQAHPTAIAARAIADGSAALAQVARASRTPIVLVDAGVREPTAIAARAIADGSAALAQVARASRTPIVLVDAGVREPTAMPAAAIRLGRGPTRDLLREDAMTVVDAALGLEAGIALAVSLADDGLDVLAIGAIGVGADLASLAVLAATDGARDDDVLRAFAPDDAAARSALARGRGLATAGGLELLAAAGGPETAVLAGLMLGAASINVPVVLDSYATGAAAVIAARLAPPVTGHLIAAHAGSLTHPMLLRSLGLDPVFAVGLGHGEGIGAAMTIPLLDQVTALTTRR